MTASPLKNRLDQLYSDYQTEYLSLDPIQFLQKYSSPADQEIVGFIAAALAIGRVDLFQKAIEQVLDIMQPTPFEFIKTFNAFTWDGLDGFVYRFYKQQDIRLLFAILHQLLKQNHSLEDVFLKGYRENHPHIGKALAAFIHTMMELNPKPFYQTMPDKGKSIRHFLANPEDGSTCKRLNLFLRWMIRKDTLDIGIWKRIPPSKLIIPVDTHIARLGQKLGLTQRKSTDWKMALEITESLRKLEPDDPVKYDFSLCTIGKLNACPRPGDDFSCNHCPVQRLCLDKPSF